MSRSTSVFLGVFLFFITITAINFTNGNPLKTSNYINTNFFDTSGVMPKTPLAVHSRFKRQALLEGSIFSTIGSMIERIRNFIMSLITAPFRFARSAVMTPINMISSAISIPMNMIRNIFDLITSPFRALFNGITWLFRLVVPRIFRLVTGDNSGPGIWEEIGTNVSEVGAQLLQQGWQVLKNSVLPKLDEIFENVINMDNLPEELKSTFRTFHTIYETIHYLGIL